MFSKSAIFKSRFKTKKQWLACLLIMLLLITLVPGSALGAGSAEMTISKGEVPASGLPINDLDLSEQFIKDNDLCIDITLTNNTWASDIEFPNPSLINTLKGGFTSAGATEDADTWQDLLSSVPTSNYKLMKTDTDYDTLRITIPHSAAYDIHSDQTISFLPPASLLQDSSNLPEAVSSFTITADPQATLSGSLTEGITESDIVSGGKQLIITLINCEWKSNITTNATLRKTLFSALAADSSTAQWTNVYNALISAPDPSKVISVNNSHTILTITLPKVPAYNILAAQTITLNSLDTALISDTGFGTPTPSNIISPSFTISSDTNTINWNPLPSLIVESTIVSSGTALNLQLSDNTWASDIETNKAKQTLLLNGFTASTDVSAWNTLKTSILAAPNSFTLTDAPANTILTLTIPATSGYSISENQIITVSVPSTVLTNNYPISNSLTFTITADPSVIVSGTLTEGASEVDMVNGGKTIVATLTNATWKTDVTTDMTKRETLLDYLLSPKAGESWPAVAAIDSLNTLKAGAAYHLDNSSTVTITLPPVPGFNIASSLTIEPKVLNGTPTLFTPQSGLTYTSSALPAFKITPIESQSASISGTVTTAATESDIVSGGKSLIITLQDDIWTSDIESQSNINTLVDNIEDSASSAAWDVVQTALKASPANIVRTSDTVLTITLPPAAAYVLGSDQTINVKIPPELLTSSSANLTAGSFTVKAISASLSGTAIDSALDSKAITSGGKTIIITLANATWASDIKTDTKLNILKNCFATGTNWNSIKDKIALSNLTLNAPKNVLTIKLPAVPTYTWNSLSEEISLNTSSITTAQLSTLINEKIGSAKTLSDTVNKIKIGDTIQSSVSAALSGTALSMNTAAVAGGGRTLQISLTGGTWDPAVITSSTKIKTLVKGFTADADSTSWALVQTALSSTAHLTDNTFLLNTDKTVLTIKLPAVPNYDPIKAQTVSLKIPKSLLNPNKADVDATGEINITLPGFSTQASLETSLSDGSFVNYINTKPLSAIYLVVPPMYITSVTSNEAELGNTIIHSLDIYTTNDAQTVQAVINGTDTYTSNTPVSDGEGRRFNIGFATQTGESGNTPASSFDVKISVLNSGGSELQPATNLKISGSKSYAIAPKTDLSGSYSLYKLVVTDKNLLKNILKYYLPDNITVRTITS